MKICVLGLGYIGLPTALLFATSGHEVIGVDIDNERLDELNRGKTPFEEPSLAELLKKAKGNFKAQKDCEKADIFIVAVPTPLDPSLKIADLKAVKAAAEAIQPYLQKDNLIIVESTVPPGTCENILIPIINRNRLNKCEIYLAYCPERAIPGNTIHEMTHNERIIGGYNKKSAELAKSLYVSFVKGRIHLTELRTSELIKLMENAFRDVNIALANEFAQIAEDNGINIWDAIALANKHPRVNILKPGPGVGGHCIAIDPWFIAESSITCRMIRLAREINDFMPNLVFTNIREMVKEKREAIISVFGVAYKGNVGDTRETPARKFIKLAENEGYSVKCYDPLVKSFEYELCSLEESVKNSDCIVILTDHDVFRTIDPFLLDMRNKNVFDARNIINHEIWKQAGFNVKLLGGDKL